jgi:hypothetical protein
LFFEVFGPVFDGRLEDGAGIEAGDVTHERVFALRQGDVAV